MIVPPRAALTMALSFALMFVAAAAARAEEVPFRPHRVSPVACTVFDFLLPGTGHIHAGEDRAGALLAAGAIGIPLAGLAIGVKMNDESSSGSPGFGVILISLAVGEAVRLWGTWDAHNAAHRANVRNGWASVSAGLSPALVALGSDHRPAAGLGIQLRF